MSPNRHFLITWPQLAPQVPYCRQHLLRLEEDDKFPARVQVGPGRVAWWQDEIDEWLASRVRGAAPQRVQLGPRPEPIEPEPDEIELLRRLAAKHGLRLRPASPPKPERRRGGRSP